LTFSIRDRSIRKTLPAQSGIVRFVGLGPRLLGQVLGSYQVTMADLLASASSLEKLNRSNYSTWCARIKDYLKGQDLWDIVGGDEKTVPIDPKEKNKWEIKAGKAMYVLSVTVEDEFLHRIKDCKTPIDAWDILRTLFTKKNETKLQQLENELMSIKQGDMTVCQYFTKVKSLCGEFRR